MHETICRCLGEQTNQGIFTTDTELTITNWNRWMEEHSGLGASEIVGQNLLVAYPDIAARGVADTYRKALSGQSALLSHRFHRYVLPMPPSIHEARTFPLPHMLQSARISPLTEADRIVGTLTLIEDVTERVVRDSELEAHIARLWESEKALQISRDALAARVRELEDRNREITLLGEMLRNQSIRDPLTGLFNRRYMEESMEREISRAARAHHPLGIIMLDIDHFKKFNDSHGHPAGDALLRELGAFLLAGVRAGDIACRFGGEEFTLILPQAPADAVLQRAEDIREKVKKRVIRHQGGNLGPVSLSLGVALFPDHGVTSEELIQKADKALYAAKTNGRDRVETA